MESMSIKLEYAEEFLLAVGRYEIVDVIFLNTGRVSNLDPALVFWINKNTWLLDNVHSGYSEKSWLIVY
jgi:hypothetical protein